MGSPFNTSLWGGGVPATTVTVTGRYLIIDALRMLGVLRPGQLPSTDALSDGLRWLNEMVDSWATERLTVKSLARLQQIMTGATTYSVPSHRIEAAGFISSAGTTETPVEVMNIYRWREVAQKIQTGDPSAVYVDYLMPSAIVYPWPQPAAGDLYLYQWVTVEAFADLDTQYGFPPGYALALRFNLADQIAAAFLIVQKIPQPLLDDIRAKAVKYKAAIMKLNCQVLRMKTDDPTIGGLRWDIRTDEYY